MTATDVSGAGRRASVGRVPVSHRQSSRSSLGQQPPHRTFSVDRIVNAIHSNANRRTSLASSTRRVTMPPIGLSAKKQSRRSMVKETSEPRLSLREIQVFKEPPHTLVLVNLLTNGYLKSYLELFNLIREQHDLKKRHELARNAILLRDDEKSLMRVRDGLMKIEDSLERRDITSGVKERLNLGRVFREQQDQFLAHYFFKSAEKDTQSLTGDEESRAVACLKLGKMLLEEHNTEQAGKYLHVAHDLSEGKPWRDRGQLLIQSVCEALHQLYTDLASDQNQSVAEERLAEMYLKKAQGFAKRSLSRSAIRKSSLNFGNLYLKSNKIDESLRCLQQYKEESEDSLPDFCRACRSAAAVHLQTHALPNAVQALEESINAVNKDREKPESLVTEDERKLLLALSFGQLASIHALRADFQAAKEASDKEVENLKIEEISALKAFDTTNELRYDEARVRAGISKCHVVLCEAAQRVQDQFVEGKDVKKQLCSRDSIISSIHQNS